MNSECGPLRVPRPLRVILPVLLALLGSLALLLVLGGASSAAPVAPADGFYPRRHRHYRPPGPPAASALVPALHRPRVISDPGPPVPPARQ